jgi:cytoskeletal protein CcmA (bactofilin family)
MPELMYRNIDESEIDTILAEDFEFDGELTFEKPLLIKGKFKGDIRTEGDLYISDKAQVEATIEAGTVSVRGEVQGDINARQKLEMYSSSILKGNIVAPDLIMQSGCRFNGVCSMPEGSEAVVDLENKKSSNE